MTSSLSEKKKKPLPVPGGHAAISTLELLLTLVRSITVEPCMFLVCAGFEIFKVVITAGLYWKVCVQEFGTDPLVDCNRRQMPSGVEAQVQQDSAMWHMYGAVSQIAPLIIIAPIYGTIGDKYGRKINILLGLVGMVLFGLLNTTQFAMVWLPLIVTPIAGVMISFTGFIGSLFASCFAYIADETRDRDILTFRLSFLQVCGNVAEILFGFLAGALLNLLSYAYCMMICIILWSVAFFYVLIFLRQIPPRFNKAQMSPNELKKFKESQQSSPSRATAAEPGELVIDSPRSSTDEGKASGGPCCGGICRELFIESSKTLIRRRDGHLRAFIWITVACFFVLNISNMGSGILLGLFCLGKPLHWSPSDVAIYNGFNSVIQLVGTLCGTMLLKRCLKFHETTILLCTIVSAILRCLMIGLAVNSAMMYAAAVLGIVSNLTFAITKSLVVQFVDRDEVGKVYSLFQIATDSSVIIAFAGLSSLYSLTVAVFSGTIFVLCAALALIALIPFIWVHVEFKKHRQSRLWF